MSFSYPNSVDTRSRSGCYSPSRASRDRSSRLKPRRCHSWSGSSTIPRVVCFLGWCYRHGSPAVAARRVVSSRDTVDRCRWSPGSFGFSLAYRQWRKSHDLLGGIRWCVTSARPFTRTTSAAIYRLPCHSSFRSQVRRGVRWTWGVRATWHLVVRPGSRSFVSSRDSRRSSSCDRMYQSSYYLPSRAVG